MVEHVAGGDQGQAEAAADLLEDIGRAGVAGIADHIVDIRTEGIDAETGVLLCSGTPDKADFQVVRRLRFEIRIA